MPLFNPRNTVVAAAKPLPVLLLLDQSSSMSCGIGREGMSRIDELNSAVRSMLGDFAKLCRNEGKDIRVGIITFDWSATLHRMDGVHAYTPADKVVWHDLNAEGYTALGDALTKAKAVLEDRNETPGVAYRPLVVLVSDGEPNDEWQGPLRDFVGAGRSAKCERLSLMIGSDGTPEAMRLFAEGSGNEVIRATHAGEISRFFKFVTMSVSTRSRSANPNVTPEPRISLGKFMQSTVQSGDSAFGDTNPFL